MVRSADYDTKVKKPVNDEQYSKNNRENNIQNQMPVILIFIVYSLLIPVTVGIQKLKKSS